MHYCPQALDDQVAAPMHDSKRKVSMRDDRRMQMAKEGFEVAYIHFDRRMDEVISVAYRYVGVEEGKEREPNVEANSTSPVMT